jgi:hypothetical protein
LKIQISSDSLGKREKSHTKLDNSWPKSISTFSSPSLGELFNRQYLSDITLCAEKKEIKCHKLILLSQSEYFRELFTRAEVAILCTLKL